MDNTEKNTLNIYLLPGIGLSVNYFDSLTFPAGCGVKAIALLQPESGETIAGYAARLMRNVEEETPFVLFGMSFGGVLAREMAALRQPEAVILLSTIRHSRDLPWYFRLGDRVRLSKVVPYRLVGQVIRILRTFETAEKQPLYDNSTVSKEYLTWSLDKMLHFAPKRIAAPCFQLHGSHDRLLPCPDRKKLFIIAKGKHLMLPEKFREINHITSTILRALPAMQQSRPPLNDIAGVDHILKENPFGTFKL